MKTKLKAGVAVWVALIAMPMFGGASWASGCDGDFERIGGEWVATRHCQRQAVAHAAVASGTHITPRESSRGETREEYCRGVGHLRIETSTYCAGYSPD